MLHSASRDGRDAAGRVAGDAVDDDGRGGGHRVSDARRRGGARVAVRRAALALSGNGQKRYVLLAWFPIL